MREKERVETKTEKEPEKRAKRRQTKQLLHDKKTAIEEATASLLSANIPIVRAQQVQLAVDEKMNLEVSTKLVRTVMR